MLTAEGCGHAHATTSVVWDEECVWPCCQGVSPDSHHDRRPRPLPPLLPLHLHLPRSRRLLSLRETRSSGLRHLPRHPHRPRRKITPARHAAQHRLRPVRCPGPRRRQQRLRLRQVRCQYVSSSPLSSPHPSPERAPVLHPKEFQQFALREKIIVSPNTALSVLSPLSRSASSSSSFQLPLCITPS